MFRELGQAPGPTLPDDPSVWLGALQAPPVDGSQVLAVVDGELQKAAQVGDPRRAFDVGYQAGALGEYLIR